MPDKEWPSVLPYSLCGGYSILAIREISSIVVKEFFAHGGRVPRL